MKYNEEKTNKQKACYAALCVYTIVHTGLRNSYRTNCVEETLKPQLWLFRTFCFNHIITDLSLLYIKNNYKAG